MRTVRLGAALAVAISLGLFIVVLVRGVGLNVLNGWTIFIGIGAGVAAFLRPQPRTVVASSVALVLALVPALIGGLGLLYLVPLGFLLVGLRVLPHAAASARA